MPRGEEQPGNLERACFVDASRFFALLEQLTQAAAELDPPADAVLGVKRSGLFPAVYVSERLDLAMFTSSEIASFPADKFSHPLIVDTTCWSGGSLRSLTRKLQEAWMSLIVEARYDKRAILEAYLNEIYLGQRGSTAIHGVGEASRLYFGKDARELSVPEAALLAATINSPNGRSPFRVPDEARRRRDLVASTRAA